MRIDKNIKLADISEKQKSILEKLSKSTHVGGHLRERSKIILSIRSGLNLIEAGKANCCSRETIRKWRDRWYDSCKELEGIEKQNPNKLKSKIIDALTDRQRSGAPPIFTAEQVAQIISLAMKPPDKLNLPFTHWTPGLLSIEAAKRKIVGKISPRHVGRILKMSLN